MSRFSFLCITVVVLFASATNAADLNYTPRSEVVGSRTIEYMDIAATESASAIWDMSIILSVTDGHGFWVPGDITSFVDSQHGGGFDYSPVTPSVANRSVFVFGKQDLMDGTATVSNVVSQTASAFTMTISNVDQGFDWTKTITINAPVVNGGGYVSTIDAVTVATNNTAGILDSAPFGVNAEVGIQLNGDGNAIALDNPDTGKSKGDAHTINHPYYDSTSWFGSADTATAEDGVLAIATVSSGLSSMRQGLQFKYEDDLDLTYTDLANSLGGAKAEAGTLYGSVFQLQAGNGLREPFGRPTGIAAGESRTITAIATITAGGSASPCAQRGSEGDFNCDATIGLLDLDILGTNWGSIGLDPATSYTLGDATGDGEVGLLDLDRLGLNWGQSTSVPEPASLGLVVLGGLMMAGRR